MDILAIMHSSPVMPVIVVERIDHAVPLAKALVAGGIRVLEVTLRSPIALEAISLMREAVPDAIVGAGTVTNPGELNSAVEAGAQFLVSPGLTDSLAEASKHTSVPLLPGVMTPSDVMRARDAGFSRLKLFPAQQAGGVGMLKALGGPFADIMFCPTGGISLASAPEFLSLPNVACVGGSWLTPKTLLEGGDWEAITKLAREAAALRG
ncbi:bifunctional 4-hydroxy-2-oxoglutarate aldolase/2-dehydro-3-deoxy-phosphogluconate aldolase [Chitinivorax sp. B]|uniref:bifunctional 4-hydroxy-2-oxoglutarate aldolase/2-dehydro-3-deoxy-phosphogluconate aldolase n=1 Tax=Chitinivorax sp. B TaxID=2502235 RepID=UPI0010F577BB|nr:bifunctional 4-hydroxy-2-oxoglutarate aldolase/2-dehydro-3-deoxy-phosphogluconate aldolase [Chitinivorax sp. B]